MENEISKEFTKLNSNIKDDKKKKMAEGINKFMGKMHENRWDMNSEKSKEIAKDYKKFNTPQERKKRIMAMKNRDAKSQTEISQILKDYVAIKGIK